MEDIPEFLDRGGRVTRRQRFARFPLWERLEMASIWALPLALICLTSLGWLFGLRFGAVTASVLIAAIAAIFVGIPVLPITGEHRWWTYGGAAAAGTGLGAGILALMGAVSMPQVVTLAAVCVAAMMLLSIDITGTTPWYPGGINSFQNHYTIDLVERRCSGAAECVQVCPKDVLAMNGRRRVVEIARPEACIGCGACIVQCPEDALRFRFDDGRIVEPETVRRTRLNMLGRRTVDAQHATAR